MAATTNYSLRYNEYGKTREILVFDRGAMSRPTILPTRAARLRKRKGRGLHLSGLCVYSTFRHNNNIDRLAELIDKMRWQPVYLPMATM